VDHMRPVSAWLVPLALIAGIIASTMPGRATAATRRATPRGVQTGEASWYGKFHDGQKTASGEVYHMDRLTAAHPNLPLGTRVRVTNLNNGRSVEVRVNDRGPRIRGRIIDLSYGAAKRLGAIAAGTVPVELRVVSAPGRAAERRADRSG
jgi:rare lipoprotein A